MISVLIPLADKEQPPLFKKTLAALAKQTYHDFEVLVVTSAKLAPAIKRFKKDFPFLHVIQKSLGKSAARNLAAQQAHGEYLYHLDADMCLTPPVLAECLQQTEAGANAIIIPDEELAPRCLISRCRALERTLLRFSQTAITPLFLKRSLFEEIGGYDEDLDPMDDWNLNSKLKKNPHLKLKKIRAAVLVRETTSLKKAFCKKYRMGQIYPQFKKRYLHPFQLNPKLRLNDYLANWQDLIKNPLLSLGLFPLKLSEIGAFYWGTLHPIKPANRYLFDQTAAEYDQKRLASNYSLYKHFAETQLTLKMLPIKKEPILELGCGTGRMTTELVRNGYLVTPTDISPAMLRRYRQKPLLPKPLLVDATHLPYSNNSFPLVYALRVIWHLPTEKIIRLLKEAARVSSKAVILDITNNKRWLKFRGRDTNDHFFSWSEFLNLCQQSNLRVSEKVGLDIAAPLWLNVLPTILSRPLFPLVFRLDCRLARFLPPGRYLVKLVKTPPRH